MQAKLVTLAVFVPGIIAQWPQWPPWIGGGGSSSSSPQPTPSNPPFGATQSIWGQCGGKTYNGAVACPTGAYCRFDGNEWYQQCVPNNYPNHNDPPGTTSPGNPSIVTRTITTVVTIDNPRPTQVTTFITFLSPTTAPIRTTSITFVPDDPWRPGK